MTDLSDFRRIVHEPMERNLRARIRELKVERDALVAERDQLREALFVICSRGVPVKHLTPYGAVRAVAAFAVGKTDDAFYRDGERLFTEARAAAATPGDEQ